MTTDDLDRLEQIAKAATPGPWKATGLQYGCFYILTDDESGMVADDAPDAEAALARARGYGQGLPMEANAAHIAAFHPETAQQLITALRTEREARETAERERDALAQQVEAHSLVCTYERPDDEISHLIEHRDDYRAQANEMQQWAEKAERQLASVMLEYELENAKRTGRLARIPELEQQVEALRQKRDDKFLIEGQEWRRAQKAESALTTAQQDAARLREALEHVMHCVECGEMSVSSCPEGSRLVALTAPADPTGGQ